jgi:hypothetical protein
MTYAVPHSKTGILLSDRNKKVSLSTFLDNGKILVQIAHRFFIFAKDGTFLDEIEFEEMRKENDIQKIKNKMSKAIYKKIKKAN